MFPSVNADVVTYVLPLLVPRLFLKLAAVGGDVVGYVCCCWCC